MTFIAESLPMEDSDWRYFCEEAQAEIRSDLEAILDRMERGTTTKADAILVAGYLGLGSRYETKATVIRCAYCGKEMPEGCPHPNQFSCCGEVGHFVEEDEE